MKQKGLISPAIVIMLSTCILSAALDDRQDLGFGFHRDVIAETTANSSESVGHFSYLFYRSRKLSQSDKFAVAPSGAAIVYQDGPSGNIFVFLRGRQSIQRLTSTFPGVVGRFVWHENDGFVAAAIGNKTGHHWIKLRLN